MVFNGQHIIIGRELQNILKNNLTCSVWEYKYGSETGVKLV